MRICFIADANHPNTLNWAKHFSNELQHEIHIITLNKPDNTKNKILNHYIEKVTNKKLRYFKAIGTIKKIIKEISPDIVIGYRLTSYAFMAARTGFHPFVAVAQSQKAAGDYRVLKKPVQWLAAKYAVKKADLALAWGPHMKNDIISLGGSEEKTFVIPRGVDLRIFSYKSNTLKKDKKIINIVTTRGLNPNYNLSGVLQTVKELKKDIDIIYNIVGDGTQRSKLERISNDLGISKTVRFIGRVPYHEISNYLCNADIYISPVPEDGVSSSLLEAMAVGVFPIVTDIGANRYWAEKGCKMLFFNPSKKNDMSKKVLEFNEKRTYYDSFLKKNRNIVENEADWNKNMKIIEKKLFQTTRNYRSHEK